MSSHLPEKKIQRVCQYSLGPPVNTVLHFDPDDIFVVETLTVRQIMHSLTLVFANINPQFGVSQELESINSLIPDNTGGFLNVPDAKPGITPYLPIRASGKHFFIGNAHASQEEDELCGMGIEFLSEIT